MRKRRPTAAKPLDGGSRATGGMGMAEKGGGVGGGEASGGLGERSKGGEHGGEEGC